MVEEAYNEMAQLDKNDFSTFKKIAVKYEKIRAIKTFAVHASDWNERLMVDRFASRLLRSTQWIVDVGIQSGPVIKDKFQKVIKLSPEWEKGHFCFAKYLNELVYRLFEKHSPHGIEDDLTRSQILCHETECIEYIPLAIEHYALALKFDMRHVYQNLPRLLSLWFDFLSAKPISESEKLSQNQKDGTKQLWQKQKAVNYSMANNIKTIPIAAYYTAIPQLVSRLTHDNLETAKIVKKILE
jgi:serine/threonine-protein kinase ATR